MGPPCARLQRKFSQLGGALIGPRDRSGIGEVTGNRSAYNELVEELADFVATRKQVIFVAFQIALNRDILDIGVRFL